MIKISIIVPIYNTENYLEKCLSSLVKQTLKGIEIICVNDGATDGSQRIVDQFVSGYPHLIKSFIKENGGLGEARNFGLEKAKGEYIAFLDSDDYVEENMYECLYENAKQFDSDIVNCGFVRINENQKILSTEQTQLKQIYSSSDAILALAPAAWNKIYKKSLFLDHDIIYPSGVWYEDLPTTITLILQAKKITTVPNIFVYYVQRQNSIIYSYDSRARDIFKVLESIQEYINKYSIENNSSIESLFIIHIIFAHLFRSTVLPIKELRKEIKFSKSFIMTYYPTYYRNKKVYENLSLLKKVCVFIGIKSFQYHLYIVLLLVYKYLNQLKPIQQKW